MRKQMKKIGTVLLAAAMAFGLVGCGAKKDSAVVAAEAETPSEENEKVILDRRFRFRGFRNESGADECGIQTGVSGR